MSFCGASVLITGGTGTFGHACVRHALEAGASRVVVLARGEHRLAALRVAFPDVEAWVGDVRDRDRLDWAFRWRPDIVIHAAALKRVEVCAGDPIEAVKTNIDGTRHVVEAALWADVPRVLLISSDKACSSETVYGTTKAAAEAIALGANARRGTLETRLSAVRYGNVLGSQGSVLEAFIRARHTGTITITDPAATRFWWAIQDAVAFVEDTIGMMQGGEVWVPKLPAAEVVELARAVAPHARHEVVGMRGAEKVHEQMISEVESRQAWDLGDRFLILPYADQPWSPGPPPGAIPCEPGRAYVSADHCLAVQLSESE